MDKATVNFIQMMRERVDALCEKGDLDEAQHAASAVVEKCQHALGTDLESIDAFVCSLEVRARIFYYSGQFEESKEDNKQAIDQLDGRPDRMDQLGRLYAALGSAYDQLDRSDQTISAWEKAVLCFEKHEPPLLIDIATIKNNLGFTAKAAGDLDAAEDHFLRALEILHAEVGQKHAETASVSNNLGAVYLAAGYLEQAREMHMMALETRRELFGEEHPDTAQSHNNLALAMLATGDRAWARRHFEKALEGFEALGSEYAEDLESVASNYCDFLREEGEANLADVIAGRVKELIPSE